MRKPRPLIPGAPVRVVAPSSPVDRKNLLDGLRVLTGMGLVPLVSERVFQADGFLAGPDALRWRELVEAMTCDLGDGVLAARGGYGAMRLLPHLERHAGTFRPKLLMGFSDVTALHVYFSQRAGIVTFHGPNVTQLSRLDKPSLSATRNCLFGQCREQSLTYHGLEPVTGGVARGRLLVGNLSIFASLCGTPFAAKLEGALLVMEDVGEAPYRVDRMLTQLVMQPGGSQLAGVAFGDLSLTDLSVVHDFARRLSKPVVTGFPIGHGTCNRPVPVGVLATLDADHGILRVEEDPYE